MSEKERKAIFTIGIIIIVFPLIHLILRPGDKMINDQFVAIIFGLALALFALFGSNIDD